MSVFSVLSNHIAFIMSVAWENMYIYVLFIYMCVFIHI